MNTQAAAEHEALRLSALEAAPVKVRIEGVSKIFVSGTADVTALDDVSFTFREREFITLLGPSGCGKSTLMRILAGLEKPSAGEVTVNHYGDHLTQLSIAFQDYSILPWKTVEANVAFGLRMRGQSRREALATAHTWLETMKLTGFEKAYPAQLSGGMKQRVALARALALDPALLLLDEPFAALDAQMRQILQEEMLRQWESDRSRTAVAVTHDLDEAILLSDRIVLMTARPGRVKQIFDVPIERPRDPSVRYAPEFLELRQEIWESLREEVMRKDKP
ncbi:ABC transporter ATP-binding protein [Streptomyces albipurpureus]|uniref:ABC transporter ATP-binding protein n=1 Tax=Streptomyces albipurpureus TaxID=2897419 RepID=A0ABT0UGZ7_9ACTN|nr:ABC transporter ATP-binding protein [Streptomyces sp. CWNU-1]MCM2387586.1 ABC transporter ATP-binding protein [Streptomyces sp. CWNU-1]